MKNTKIVYMYRDADNYKNYKTLILKGKLTKKQEDHLQEMIDNDVFFIPSQMGLEELQGGLQSLDSEYYGVDHCWHELVDIELTDEEINDTSMTARKFYELITTTEWQPFDPGHPLRGY